MQLQEYLDSVKDITGRIELQAQYHREKAEKFRTEGKDGPENFHRKKQRSWQDDSSTLIELISHLKKIDISKCENSIPRIKNSKLRIGEISDLPPELVEQLSGAKVDDGENEVISIIRDDLNGVALIDEILVGIYRRTGEVKQRGPLNQKLYRMVRKGLIHTVPNKKGMYSTHPVDSHIEK